MWSYEIDEERRLVITTAWDVVTSDEILEHRRQLKSDTRFRRTFFQLLDLTRVTGIALDYQTSLVLAHENLFSGDSRRAFVAPSPLAFGMSRMYITIRQFYGEAEQIGRAHV